MLQWQNYWKIEEKHRKMSFGAELFLLLLLFFIFLSLQLVSADWCVLQQGKLIVRFVVLLLTDTRIPCSTTHFLLKWARWQNLDAFHWVLCTTANWLWGGLSKSGSFLWKRAFLSNTIIKTCVSINCLTVQSVVRAEENVCPGETETKDDVWGCLAPNMQGLHGWFGVRRRRSPHFREDSLTAVRRSRS